ncbi:MAG: Sir2 silent information regulator family NAD-dependent deacetylase [Spirochaetales bacterium]|nr:Sir2 silent information regulator family NAD-dependent deacetylase [Spirochaetales bacterium]
MTKIEALKSKLDEFDTILIGAGAGLSASAGYTYSGQRFDEYFADFRDRYGFTDMYSGGFYPYETQEEFWAYWSRYIMINRYSDIPKPVYSDLLQLVQDKDYFVITTNVDHCFQKAGFDKKRLFYTQGDYGLFQCSEPCHQQTYDNEQTILRMWQAGGMSIPSELIPHCPKCGKPMSMNLRSDDTFVQDSGWYAAAERYSDFIDSRSVSSCGKVLLLELGVGGNTPVIIKYPFWQMTARNPNAFYVCINYGEAAAPQEIADRSLCIDADIGAILAGLRNI